MGDAACSVVCVLDDRRHGFALNDGALGSMRVGWLIAAIWGCAMAAACTSYEPKVKQGAGQNPPKVRIGPDMKLYEGNSGLLSDPVTIVADPAGEAHVLFASRMLKQVIDVVVDKDGVREKRSFSSGIKSLRISAAFAPDGKLHVLVDDQHMVLSDGEWRTAQATPWGKAGLRGFYPQVVSGGSDLVWTFEVDGADASAPGHFQFFLGPGFIVPWFTHGRKAVLVSESETEHGPWRVLELKSVRETRALNLATDRRGQLHVTYEYYQRETNRYESRYLCFPLASESSVAAGRAPGTGKATPVPMLEVRVGTTFIEGSFSNYDASTLAVDPETGTALVGMRWLFRGANRSGPFEPPFSVEKGSAIQYTSVAPAGGDAYHAVVAGATSSLWHAKRRVYYMMLKHERWSDAVQLADDADSTPSVAAIRDGTALAVWSTPQGWVGRWIEAIR